MARWTLADLQAVRARIATPTPETAPKAQKYRNEPFVYNGRKYSSKLEAYMAQVLDLRWKAGEVLWWTGQVPFVLEGGVTYRTDALAALRDGPPYFQVIDATGLMTQTKKNKLKQLEARYGITCLIFQRDGSLRPYHECRVSRTQGPPLLLETPQP